MRCFLLVSTLAVAGTLVACGEGPVQLTGPVDGNSTQTESPSVVAEVLPLPMRMRAIAARERLERQLSRPTSTRMREYDELGRVRKEIRFTAAGAQVRTSTLPTALADRPLRSFLAEGIVRTGGTASISSGTLLKKSHTTTLGGVSVTMHDTTWTGFTSQEAEAAREGSDTAYNMFTTAWFPSGVPTDSFPAAEGADIYSY